MAPSVTRISTPPAWPEKTEPCGVLNSTMTVLSLRNIAGPEESPGAAGTGDPTGIQIPGKC